MSTFHTYEDDEHGSREWAKLHLCVLWLGLAAAVIWLYFLHDAHLLELLPFLVVLACPLVHRFGVSRHAQRAGAGRSGQETEPRSTSSVGGAGGCPRPADTAWQAPEAVRLSKPHQSPTRAAAE